MNKSPHNWKNQLWGDFLISLLRYIVILLSGGTLYTFIELLWRNESHWSMTVLGGISFLVIYLMKEWAGETSIFLRCFAGAAFITLMEYITGHIVNIKLGLDVWDYSLIMFHVDGQICLAFSVLWFFLCMLAFLLCRGFQNIFKFIDKLGVE